MSSTVLISCTCFEHVKRTSCDGGGGGGGGGGGMQMIV